MRKKCLQCNGKLFRSYIRQNKKEKDKIKRNWKTIGFYCLNCEVNYTEKELSKDKTKKSKQK